MVAVPFGVRRRKKADCKPIVVGKIPAFLPPLPVRAATPKKSKIRPLHPFRTKKNHFFAKIME
jgi:hypothetical protein